jgi:DNA-binding NarL/FixJ family response regulator
MQGLTVLVVDELVSFREAVCGMLHATPFPVVGEPADGRDAVQMAKELQPDLIVLGLGLPQLNGLETAKRLRTLAPQAKLLFLSQESCPDAVREAFDLGASGYIHKTIRRVTCCPLSKRFLGVSHSLARAWSLAEERMPRAATRYNSIPMIRFF